jgi:hypothetical protein
MSPGRKDRRQARLTQCSRRPNSTTGLNPLDGLSLPEPFSGASVQKVFSLADVPTAQALTDVLEAWAVSTKEWGVGNTKEVSKYWKEIKENEAGLEVWKTRTGKSVPVRVTHVLRAKVSSPDAYSRGIFLFNTWQQYGDGRKRVRNGLLSEKLTLNEMPLIAHLHEVCERAVTEEEMQRVVDSSLRIGPQSPAPTFDPHYRCPLQVVSEEFVDHTVEIEVSKSYPGLMTVYHLYTVDIICDGLPPVDFNTLEFEHPDKDGNRKLKYIHAWVWLEWSMIQRYLFDGSEMKERKSKGSFKTPEELESWLSQFDVDLESWGMPRVSFGGKRSMWKSVEKLWRELESSQTQLERWGRNDGVPLLMRVVHVLQLKVTSTEASKNQKFLFQVWNQAANGQIRDVNRTMAKKLSASDVPFDAAKFDDAVRQVVKENLSYLADVHARLDTKDLPTESSSESSGVNVLKVDFSDHRFDLEDSPSFKDISTMYHLYTVNVVCEGLPNSDFASIAFDASGTPSAIGWKWVTWQETLDILHQRAQLLERREAMLSERVREASEACRECLEELAPSGPNRENDLAKAGRLANQLQDLLALLSSTAESSQEVTTISARLPPSMVANLADRKGVSDDFLDGALFARQSPRQPSVEEGDEPVFQAPREVDNGARLDCNKRCQPGFCNLFCGTTAMADTSVELQK